MKRYIKIITIILLGIILIYCLVSCAETIIDDQGKEAKMIDGNFVIIAEEDAYNAIVYNLTTKVVYYREYESHGGYLAPYIIYQDGALYGAVYENGEIIPVPYK